MKLQNFPVLRHLNGRGRYALAGLAVVRLNMFFSRWAACSTRLTGPTQLGGLWWPERLSLPTPLGLRAR